jgi:fructose/tagatose bisphosphate aldolase
MPPTIHDDIPSLIQRLDGAVRLHGSGVEIQDANAVRNEVVDDLVWTAVFGEGETREAARWLIRTIAPAAGAWLASIHELYMAAGRDAYANITTPAINVRGMAYDVARTIFRAAHATESRQMLFELARSEMTYTDQRPAEYASVVLAAAIREGWQGPVFIQGDHYQANAKKYAADPEGEIRAVRELAVEAIAAGYGNIDIDSSTLVDLSHESLRDQQELNARHTAELTKAIRDAEPAGLTVSVGGEIGEVGKENSTVDDLNAFMEAYQEHLDKLGENIVGISKISVQTGTSHGGVVLPDGTIKDVAVDFETLAKLSRAAKDQWHIGGAVQHGASTLPESAFGRFAEANAVEVHLATAFQNLMYDSEAFPTELRDAVYAYLDEHLASDRKPDQNDTQFHYTTRKQAFGAFKRQFWTLPEETKSQLCADLQPSFELIMRELRVAGNGDLVDRFVTRVDVEVPAPKELLTRLG